MRIMNVWQASRARSWQHQKGKKKQKMCSASLKRQIRSHYLKERCWCWLDARVCCLISVPTAVSHRAVVQAAWHTSPSRTQWFAMCSTCSGIWWQSTLKILVTTEAQPVFTWCQWLASWCAPTAFSLSLSWQHGMCIIFRKVVSACCGIGWQSTLKIIVTSPGARGLLPGMLQLHSHLCPGSTACVTTVYHLQ